MVRHPLLRAGADQERGMTIRGATWIVDSVSAM